MRHRQTRLSALVELFDSKTVLDLEQICGALEGASRATAFRYLRDIDYRRSYNRNGRYYTKHDNSRYDRFGLFSHRGIHFSRDGSLNTTVVRLVREAPAGFTQHELQDLLRVRVHMALHGAAAADSVIRERLQGFFVYLHPDPAQSKGQVERRKQQLEPMSITPVSDSVVIQVLLVLIHYPASRAADVVRHLRGHAPPITTPQVQQVFDRYDLDNVEKKGGPTIF